MRPRLKAVIVPRKVILGLWNVGEKDFIAVGKGLAVILIGSHRGLRGGCDGVSLLLIAGLERREGRHVHVSRHMRHTRRARLGRFRLFALLVAASDSRCSSHASYKTDERSCDEGEPAKRPGFGHNLYLKEILRNG